MSDPTQSSQPSPVGDGQKEKHASHDVAPTATASAAAAGQGEQEQKQTDTGDDKKKQDKDGFEELQNEITKKWTEEEWKAVRELRAKLPEVLKQAFPDDPSASKKPVELWGVALDPNAVPGNGAEGAKVLETAWTAKASVVLHKFVKARSFDIPAAAAQLASTLSWRSTFDAPSTATESFPTETFGSLGFLKGKDREGRPITWNVYGSVKDNKEVFGDVQRFLRWRVGLMEKGIKQIDFETVDTVVQVHDYAGVGLSSRDQYSKEASSQAVKLFQDYYPELLSRKFFVNVPTFLSWIYTFLKPFFSKATLDKFTVVGQSKDAICKALLEVIPEEELPEEYGGKGKALDDDGDVEGRKGDEAVEGGEQAKKVEEQTA